MKKIVYVVAFVLSGLSTAHAYHNSFLIDAGEVISGKFSNERHDASSVTLQGNSVDIASMNVRIGLLAGSTAQLVRNVEISSRSILEGNATTYFRIDNTSQTKVGHAAFHGNVNMAATLTAEAITARGVITGDGSGITNISGFVTLGATQTHTGRNTFTDYIIVDSQPAVGQTHRVMITKSSVSISGMPSSGDDFQGLLIQNDERDDAVRSTASLVLMVRSSNGLSRAKISAIESTEDHQEIGLGFFTPLLATAEPSLKMVVLAGGNVGIGTEAPAEKLQIAGNTDITGTLTKGAGTFKIPHPDDPKKWLYHGFVEAPEFGLLYRGKSQLVGGEATITLPAYFLSVGSIDDLTVNLTPVGGFSPIYVKAINPDGTIDIKADSGNASQPFHWTAYTRRIDPFVMDGQNGFTDVDGNLVIEPDIEVKDKQKKTKAQIDSEIESMRKQYNGYR